MNPKVSIIVPVYNVEPYLRECMDSIVRQTLAGIEVICVNDGSTDGSLAILREFEEFYSFVKVIDKENGGYGKAMNAGLKAAQGDYIGIVESDDFCSKRMFENLYLTAKAFEADAVKSNYFRHTSFPTPLDSYYEALADCDYDVPFTPREDQEIFYASPAIWSGLYKRSFLLRNDIWFTETPGASYQDTAFNFKVWACADTAVAIRQAFLHYRVDNENSSVKSRGKVDYVNYEFKEIERFLDARPEIRTCMLETKNALKYGTYWWNLTRLAPSLRYDYYQLVLQEFQSAQQNDELDEKVFSPAKWKDLQAMLRDPDAFYESEFGPRYAEASIVLDVGDNLQLLRRTLRSLQGQTCEELEILCCARVWKPEISKELKRARKKDKRVVLLESSDYLAGALDVSTLAGDVVVFMSAGHVLNSDMVEVSAEFVRESGRVLVDYNAPGEAPSMLGDYYRGSISAPLVCGPAQAFEGMPISPYSMSLAAPLLAAGEVMVIHGLCDAFPDAASVAKTRSRKTLLPPAREYKKHVEDFRVVQKYCEPLACKAGLEADYIRFSYKLAGWLKWYFKLLPDEGARNLSDAYRPSVFLDRLIEVHDSAASSAAADCGSGEATTSATRETRGEAALQPAGAIKNTPENIPSCDVSIIIPMYNKAEYLVDCINSIVSQTLETWEVIAVDDGSTDETLEVALELHRRDSRIIVVEKANNGAGMARNSALELARGQYVMFLDADDFLPTGTVLESLMFAAKSSGSDIVGGSLLTFYESGGGFKRDFTGDQVKYTFTQAGQVDYVHHQYDYGFVRFIYRRALLERHGIRFPDLAWFEDPVFLVQAMIAAGGFYSIPDAVYAYRQTHKPSEISWPDYRVCDLVRGLNANLEASKAAGLPDLHAQCLSRLQRDYFPAIRKNLGCRTLLPLLLESNELLSVDLLREADIYLREDYVISPLVEYTAQVTAKEKQGRELRLTKKKLKRSEEKRKALRKSTVLQRGVTALPRYLKKFALSCRDKGVKTTMAKAKKRFRAGLS